MDKARWLVVFSVVFFMILTLSLLQHSRVSQEYSQKKQLNGLQSETGSLEQKHVFNRDKVEIHGEKIQIKYSKRPAHLFSADKPEEFKREDREFKDKGKIIE